MRKIKINKFLLISFLFIFFVSFSQKATADEWWEGRGYIIINTDTVWEKSDDLFFDKKVVIVNGAKLTIEKGASVKFGKDGIFLSSLEVIDGTIIAEGTKDEKITFTADEVEGGVYSINFYTNPDREASFFRYVEISNGGFRPQFAKNKIRLPFVKTAMADFFVPAIEYSSGRLHLENCEFKNNIYGDVSANGFFSPEDADYLEIVNSNFNGDVNHIAINSFVDCYDEEADEECDKFFLINNWYGDFNGPSGEVLNYETEGVVVSGYFYLNGWRKNDMIADPVIIIPGITGSEKVFGEWRLDPILHTYDDLVESLEKNGYEKEKNLFEFPYDWKNSNEITADDLKIKIQEIKDETKISKVDLVAHSMGGLVSRQYIENDIYNNDIDQLITLGTPHSGAPESYLKWEAGEGFFTIRELLAKHHFKNEASHNGYDDIFSYIQEKVLSVKELLPNYDYLFDVANNSMRNYSDNYPRNNFLEELNKESNLEKLKKVSLINIVGNLGNEESTIGKIRVVDSTIENRWEDGMPENFYDNKTDRGLENNIGDSTVPLKSAKSIPSDKEIEINSTHGNLPTEAQCEILQELTGKSDCSKINKIHISSIFLFNLFSPIDIQVVSPSGKWMGKNILGLDESDQIEGAYYTGFETENEFLTIPNPEDGEYRIITEGTGAGEYRIEMAKITENENGEASEITGEIKGSATTGIQEEKTVEVLEDEIITEEKDITSPTITIQSPQNRVYQSDEIISIEFDVTDDDSGVNEEKAKSFIDDEIFSQYKINMAYLKKGEHSLKVSAEDNSGNLKEEVLVFTVQSTIDSIISNIDRYYADKYITKKSTRNYLRAKLNVIKIHQSLYDLVKFSHWPNRLKSNLLKNIAKVIDREIESLISDIQNKRTISKTILEPVAGILVGSLEEMKFL